MQARSNETFSLVVEPFEEDRAFLLAHKGREIELTVEGWQSSTSSYFGRSGAIPLFVKAKESLHLRARPSTRGSSLFSIALIEQDSLTPAEKRQWQMLAASFEEVQRPSGSAPPVCDALCRFAIESPPGAVSGFASTLSIQRRLQWNSRPYEKELIRATSWTSDSLGLEQLLPIAFKSIQHAEIAMVAGDHERADYHFRYAIRQHRSRDLDAQHDELEQLEFGGLLSNAALNLLLLSWKKAETDDESSLNTAQTWLLEAVAIGSTHDDPALAGDAHTNLGALSYIKQAWTDLLSHLEIACGLLAHANSLSDLAAAQGQLGDHYRRLGDLRSARLLYESALETTKLVRDGKLISVSHQRISSFFQEVGEVDLAREHAELGLSAAEGISHKGEIARAERVLAEALLLQGKLKEARSLAESALSHQIQHGSIPLVATARAFVGKVALAQGDLESAISQTKLAHDAIKHTRSLTYESLIINQRARVLYATGRKDESVNTLKNFVNNTKGPLSSYHLPILNTLLNILNEQNAVKEAIRYSEVAFRLIEDYRLDLEPSRSGPLWVSQAHEIFDNHIGLLLNQKERTREIEARAFKTSERIRGFGVRQQRKEDLARRAAKAPSAKLGWHSSLQLSRKLGAKNSTERETQKSPLARERSLNRTRSIEHATEDAGLFREDFIALNANEVAHELSEGEALYQLVEGGQTYWRFIIRPDQWSVSNIGSSSTIRESAKLIHHGIQDPSTDPARLLSGLGTSLFEEIEKTSAISKLYISLPSELQSIPVHAFEQLSAIDELVHLTSTSEFFSRPANQIRETLGNRLSLTVLADPQLTNIDVDESAAESKRTWARSLKRLPHTAREAANISHWFNTDEIELFLGAEATRSALLSAESRKAKILHIASHGYFDPSIPDLVGLAVTPSSKEDDGFLSYSELARFSFSSELVVLSACDTGLGRSVAGVGVLSLAQSFLAQGAKTVIATLWPVSDAATAQFMKHFYYALRSEQHSIEYSLRYAQRKLKKNKRYTHPYFWAAFSVFTT